MHACGSCGGVFLDVAAASRFWSALPADAWQLAANASQHAPAAADVRGVARCPVCRAEMRRAMVAAAGVEIDDCPPHGLWYDRHELTAIAHAVHRLREAAPPQPGAGPTAGPTAGRGRMVGAGPGAWGAGPAVVAGAALGGAAVVGGAAVSPARGRPRDEEEEESLLVAGADVVETGVDVVDLGSEVVDAGGGDLLGGAFDLVGGLLDW